VPCPRNKHNFRCDQNGTARRPSLPNPVRRLANLQAVFGDLTGDDARPTLWRGRPRPRYRRFSAGYERFHIGPIPEVPGEPSGLKMIRITAFAEKSDQACGFFLRNASSGESPRRIALPSPAVIGCSPQAPARGMSDNRSALLCCRRSSKPGDRPGRLPSA